MDIISFVDFLKDKRSDRFKTDNDVANYLGTKPAQIASWRTKKRAKKRAITNLQIAGLFERSRKEALRTAIRPIVEFYPIVRVRSRQKGQWELFTTDKGAPRPARGLRAALDNSCGVYVFYDTRGRALYAGKTENRTLWKEMKSAFNRDRGRQELFRVRHPGRNQEFVSASKRPRNIRQTSVVLADMAAYFSAYEVAPDMIGAIETLLIRAFANDLLNTKMEAF